MLEPGMSIKIDYGAGRSDAGRIQDNNRGGAAEKSSFDSTVDRAVENRNGGTGTSDIGSLSASDQSLSGTESLNSHRGYGSDNESAVTDNPDKLIGTSGDDRISGLGGNDYLKGLGGQDTLDGDSGDDYLRGDKGGDIYILGKNFGFDTIEDDNDTSGGNRGDIIRLTDDSFSDITSIKVIDEKKDDLQITTRNGTVNIKDFRTNKDTIETIEFADSTMTWNGDGYEFEGPGILVAADSEGFEGGDTGAEGLAEILHHIFGPDPFGIFEGGDDSNNGAAPIGTPGNPRDDNESGGRQQGDVETDFPDDRAPGSPF